MEYRYIYIIFFYILVCPDRYMCRYLAGEVIVIRYYQLIAGCQSLLYSCIFKSNTSTAAPADVCPLREINTEDNVAGAEGEAIENIEVQPGLASDAPGYGGADEDDSPSWGVVDAAGLEEHSSDSSNEEPAADLKGYISRRVIVSWDFYGGPPGVVYAWAHRGAHVYEHHVNYDATPAAVTPWATTARAARAATRPLARSRQAPSRPRASTTCSATRPLARSRQAPLSSSRAQATCPTTRPLTRSWQAPTSLRASAACSATRPLTRSRRAARPAARPPVEIPWLMLSPLYGQADAGAIWNRTLNDFLVAPEPIGLG